MREQGIAANATRRFLRGQTKRKNTDKVLRALHRGLSRAMARTCVIRRARS
jgi:hypothetical protein